MKLINVTTREITEVESSVAENWINSCTPWMSFDRYCAKGMGEAGNPTPELEATTAPSSLDTSPPFNTAPKHLGLDSDPPELVKRRNTKVI